MIEVRRVAEGDPLRFEVAIREGAVTTRHEVTMDRSEFAKLAADTHSAERCIEAVFRFLLDRESKEAILKHFDVAVVARYFPEFHREFPAYLVSR